MRWWGSLVCIALVGCTSERRAPEPVHAQAGAALMSTSTMLDARENFACATLPNGSLFAAGGGAVGGIGSSTAEVMDPTTLHWSYTDPMHQGRSQHAAIALADGRILVAGGYSSDVGDLSSVEIFDPTKNTFVVTGAMGVPRRNAALAKLADGTIVAAGGGTKSLQRFDVASGTWKDLPSTFAAHDPAIVVALAKGGALIAGPGGAPEVLDAALGTYTVTAPQVVGRTNAGYAALADGSALALGGIDGSGMPLKSTEVLDPTTRLWSLGVDMLNPRMLPSAIADTNQIFLASGSDSTAVELYFNAQFYATGALGTARTGTCVADFPASYGEAWLGGVTAGVSPGPSRAVDIWLHQPDGASCSVYPECGGGDCIAGVCNSGPDASADAPTPPDAATDSRSEVASPADAAAVDPTTIAHCLRDADCPTGHCSDGVCCDSACTDRCHSCVLPGSVGRCAEEPVGVDLRGECGAALACTGTCGPAGTCIGAGAGTQCSPAHCTTESHGVGPAACDIKGAACPTQRAVEFACEPYACDPTLGACAESCRTSADCAGGFLCDAPSKTCVAATPSAKAGCQIAPASSERSPSFFALTIACAMLMITRGPLRRATRKRSRRAQAFADR
jgi:hypothetical protein